MNKDKINLFNSVLTNEGITISINDLVKLITNNPKAKQYKQDYSALIANGRQLDAFSKQGIETRKINSLLTTCIGGYYPKNNKSKGEKYELTQYVYLDYDAKENNFSSPEHLEYLKEEISKIDEVKLVCTSSSGQGLSVIISAEGITDENYYKGTYYKAANLIARKVDNSLKVDKQATNGNRLWILPYDPNVKFNVGTFKLKAVKFEKPANTQSPNKASKTIAFGPSASALYCDFLKPPPKDRFRVRIYADDIIEGYQKTDAGSIYIPEGKIVPIKPHFVGNRKWKTGDRNKRFLPTILKLLIINKGITQRGFEAMLLNLNNRFEEKWSSDEIITKGFRIKVDFEQGKFNLDQLVKIQKRFYPKALMSNYSRSIIDKENNFILNRFILKGTADLISSIIKHAIETPEYQIKKLTIDDIARLTAIDKRRIKTVIELDQDLKELIEKQNKESIISHKPTYEVFCNFCDAMNANATKQEIIDTLGIKQSTYYVYKAKFETIEGLDERTPNYKE